MTSRSSLAQGEYVARGNRSTMLDKIDERASSLGNVAEMLLETATAMGDKAAIADGESTVSYADLAFRSLAMAEVLEQEEVKPGDRVAILLPRGADAASAFFGSAAAGAVAIMVNETLRWRQIEHILKHSSAQNLLTSESMLRRLSKPV